MRKKIQIFRKQNFLFRNRDQNRELRIKSRNVAPWTRRLVATIYLSRNLETHSLRPTAVWISCTTVIVPITHLCHHSWTGRPVTKLITFNPLNPELNPICYLLALLGAHHFLHVSRIRVKLLTFRLLMFYIYIYIYIYGAPILDVSRSHTTTQHSR